MSDAAQGFNLMMASFRAADQGDFEEAIALQDSILRLDVPPNEKVSARIFKSYYLLQLDKNDEAAREAETALELDRVEHTREFEEEDNRGMVLGNLDCEWLDQLKAFGRDGNSAAGIQYGETKLRLLDHVPGSYMPLTQIWIGRKLAILGENERAIERLRAGLSAEVMDTGNYVRIVEKARRYAEKAVEMHTSYGAVSPKQAVEKGLKALLGGETAFAIRAFHDALELEMGADATAETKLFLALAYAQRQQCAEAVSHGEEALRLDAEHARSLFSDPENELSEFGIQRLELCWEEIAADIAKQQGASAARSYLLERLELVEYLGDHYFPLLRLAVGRYSVQMGDRATARDNLVNAVFSEFPYSGNAMLDEFYKRVRTEAAQWVRRG